MPKLGYTTVWQTTTACMMTKQLLEQFMCLDCKQMLVMRTILEQFVVLFCLEQDGVTLEHKGGNVRMAALGWLVKPAA